MIFKKIIGTAGTRIFNAAVNLIVLLMITNFIGSKGLGEISLIIVNLTIIQLFVDWMAGSALVYFASRANLSRLLIPAYLWSLIILAFFVGMGTFIHFLFPQIFMLLIPKGFEIELLVLALLNAFMQTHYNLLIGQKKIKQYNIIFSVQISSLLVFFTLFLFGLSDLNARAYINALILSWGIGGGLGFYQILRSNPTLSLQGWHKLVRPIFLYGLQTQISNVLHLGNKRLSYYVIRIYAGLSPLGIYGAAVQLAEGLRLIGQSISLVQFSAISNSREKEYARVLTLKLMKFSMSLTFLALAFLLLIPQRLYQIVFSAAFGDIKTILVALSVGILALAANTIFSHYFSGIGQPKINVYANTIGFLFTLVLLFLLIPKWGAVGAALAASVSYSATVTYQAVIFKNQTQTRWNEWIIHSNDVAELTGFIKEIFQKTKKVETH